MTTSDRATSSAIVVAGGGSTRFGSDKLSAVINGQTVLQQTVDALNAIELVVVVGPVVPLRQTVTWTREEPPGGGPVVALGAGLAQVSTDMVVVLAGDMPWAKQCVTALLDHRGLLTSFDALVASNAAGDIQPLAALWQTAALVHRVNEVTATNRRSAMSLYDHTAHHRVVVSDASLRDVDTPADLDRR